MTASTRLVPCPTCAAPCPFAPTNRWRPFCSERCRNVDLGAWASERFRVAAAENPADDAPVEDVGPADAPPRH
jgi:endogenous inhibitor of DNA gyrase (YacG/DUF329 family)